MRFKTQHPRLRLLLKRLRRNETFLPSLLPSSHRTLLLSERVHVRTGCQTKPATDDPSPAVKLSRCMENHRPASAAKSIDGAQPCCSEGEKSDRALKGPASSQPHRLQGSLIKRLMGNSIPRISPKATLYHGWILLTSISTLIFRL